MIHRVDSRNWEAKVVAPIIVNMLTPYLFKPIYDTIGIWAIAGPLLIGASNNVPADLNFQKCEWNPKLRGLVWKILNIEATLQMISQLGGEKLKRFVVRHNVDGDLARLDLLKSAIYTAMFTQMVQFEGDSAFSKTYQVAKGCLSSLISRANQSLRLRRGT